MLQQAGVPDAEREATTLLALNAGLAEPLIYGDGTPEQVVAALDAYLDRRLLGKDLAQRQRIAARELAHGGRDDRPSSRAARPSPNVAYAAATTSGIPACLTSPLA